MTTKDEHRKTIVFFHPDLGIGGAERLVIDAAVGLQNRGHKVCIFTSHCDPKHCFDEARDGTLDVRVRGNSIVPSSILSRFSILCAILRQIHLIFSITLTSELSKLQPDAFFVDQLSAGLPLLRLFYPATRILFYCHFPDLLLAQGRASLWKRLYRIPFDTLEEWSMGFADAVCVNSKFTAGMVSKVWPEFVKNKDLQVVYPCVDTKEKKLDNIEDLTMFKDLKVILSINRFEKKKDVGLAIKAYAALSADARKGSRLVVAGGYDNRMPENVSYHKELVELAESLGLKIATTKTIVTALSVPADTDVLYLLSVPNTLKEALLSSARLLVYTPSNEHFGIVPLEAMLAGVPVLAANTGGPLETVIDKVTGWHCAPDDVSAWSAVMDSVLNTLTDVQVRNMGKVGIRRVQNDFSDVKMAARFDGIISGMDGLPRKKLLPWWFWTVPVAALDLAFWATGRFHLQEDAEPREVLNWWIAATSSTLLCLWSASSLISALRR
ncbi:Alpha-1,3/1,6-mannosyltransferase alg-2 [Phlyctema vagabunda]|uniref:Alpha-1,3/1,6-mannosyltransferase ALG2 n=1 Tax=Phlyctema vagabunda TaxID=108571 RepID=A0ABR4PDM5_9HELO